MLHSCVLPLHPYSSFRRTMMHCLISKVRRSELRPLATALLDRRIWENNQSFAKAALGKDDVDLVHFARKSCLKMVRFCVNLSLFLGSRVRVTSAMSLSKHPASRCCWSGGCNRKTGLVAFLGMSDHGRRVMCYTKAHLGRVTTKSRNMQLTEANFRSSVLARLTCVANIWAFKSLKICRQRGALAWENRTLKGLRIL